jgi:hypothetical protein
MAETGSRAWSENPGCGGQRPSATALLSCGGWLNVPTTTRSSVYRRRCAVITQTG